MRKIVRTNGLPRRWFWIPSLSLLLCSCIAAKGGRDFDTDGLSAIRPGVSTVQDAAASLGGPPYQIWKREDGSTWAHWLYFHVSYDLGGTRVNNKELTLEFDPEGHFADVVAARGEAADALAEAVR